MYQIHTEVTDSLVADVASNLKGKRFSRALWLDIEPGDNESYPFSLVLRGRDDVTADAPDSKAKDAEDRAEHNAKAKIAAEKGVFWTLPQWVESQQHKYGGYWTPRTFILASFDDQATADQVCAELLSFYSDAVASEENPALSFSERVGGLTAPALAILPVLLAVFGSAPNSDMLKSGHLGTFADYLAGREKKAKPTPRRKSEDQIKAEAQQEVMRRIIEQIAGQPGSNQAQMLAIIAQLQLPVSAKPTQTVITPSALSHSGEFEVEERAD